jgi:hypothetical protein
MRCAYRTLLVCCCFNHFGLRKDNWVEFALAVELDDTMKAILITSLRETKDSLQKRQLIAEQFIV